jgi:hypothetical protein
MNASLQVEEDSRRIKDIKTKQQLYKEELDFQAKEKLRFRQSLVKEDKIWLNNDVNAMERFDQIENLNSRAKKNKVMEERKKREEMMHARQEKLRHEKEQEERKDHE